MVGAFCVAGVPDNDLLSHGQSVLSSACRRFTVLFGMGRGGAGGLWSSGVEVREGKGDWLHRRDPRLWSQAARAISTG
jgi:hypothetical protein